MGLAVNIEPDNGIWGETRYIGGEYATFLALGSIDIQDSQGRI